MSSSDSPTSDFASCTQQASRIPESQHAELSSKCLAACLEHVTAIPEVAEVLAVANDRKRWVTGHRVFDAVRDVTLSRECLCQGEADRDDMILYVAENTARVIYNASDPLDPFDDDSMAWVLVTLAQFAETVGNANFSNELQRLISSYLPD